MCKKSDADRVVLGAAMGTGQPQAAAFVGSLLGTGYASRIALIIEPKQVKPAEVAVRERLLRNRNGEVASIVHMYDRLPELSQQLGVIS